MGTPELPLALATAIRGNGEPARVAILLSGGVDSSVLLSAVVRLLGKDRVLAVTAESALLSYLERDFTRRICRNLGVEHTLVPVPLLDLPDVYQNGPDRCYNCKKAICDALVRVAVPAGIRRLLDGTNADDILEHRPGLEALRKAGVISPFADAGMSKEPIRELGRRLAVEGPDRPSQSCLATRIPVGRIIDEAELSLIERLETEVRRDARGRLRLLLHEDEAEIQFEATDSELLEQHRDWLMEELMAAGVGLIRFSLTGSDSSDLEGSPGAAGDRQG